MFTGYKYWGYQYIGLVGATYRACINPVKDPYRFCTVFIIYACINPLIILYRTHTGMLQDFLGCPYRSCTGPMCILNRFIRAPVRALLCLRACPCRSCTVCTGLPIQVLYRPCLGMFTGLPTHICVTRPQWVKVHTIAPDIWGTTNLSLFL